MTPSILMIVRIFNAPHRAGFVNFPHPAPQFNSPNKVIHKSHVLSSVLEAGNVQGGN